PPSKASNLGFGIEVMENPRLAGLIEHIERQREERDPLHIRSTGLWPVGPAGLQPAGAPPAHGALESGGTRFRASWTCSLRLRRADGSERSTSLRGTANLRTASFTGSQEPAPPFFLPTRLPPRSRR